MFMTERDDPRALYDVMYGCNPDTDALQMELGFDGRDTERGGSICVGSASEERHEFRYSPPGNTGELSCTLVFRDIADTFSYLKL